MDRNALDQLQNSTVFATDGDKIGSVGQVYLDDVTNEPTFVTVKTGLFGARETFVPLQQAQTTADGITVPFEKSFVKDAPNVDADGSLTPEEEQRIYEYYSMEYSAADYDGDVEVTTYEETPVVNKTVDAEKVSLGKRQVQDTETVTEEVRHEDVKVDGDATDRDLDGRNDRKDRI